MLLDFRHKIAKADDAGLCFLILLRFILILQNVQEETKKCSF